MMMNVLRQCWIGPFALALALGLYGSDALADTAAAQALFDQGKKLMADGQYDEACPKLAESQKLDPQMGTQYQLGHCYEQTGKTASAWSQFLAVAGQAKSENKPDHEKKARERAAALEPKLTRLTIAVPADAPSDLQITRDGTPIGQAQWNTAIPVDPGEHNIEATSGGKKLWQVKIQLNTPGATETAAVDLKSAPPAQPDTPEASSKMHRRTGMMVTGIVLGGVGLISGIAGAAYFGICENGRGNVEIDCSGPYRPVSIGLMGLGVVGLAVGIPLIVVGAKKVPVDEKPQEASAVPTVMLSPTYASARWSF